MLKQKTALIYFFKQLYKPLHDGSGAELLDFMAIYFQTLSAKEKNKLELPSLKSLKQRKK
jgi:hypothetical protein